eukprot:scaffold134587_cov18-Tisochrysis_lutea.AAC.2
MQARYGGALEYKDYSYEGLQMDGMVQCSSIVVLLGTCKANALFWWLSTNEARILLVNNIAKVYDKPPIVWRSQQGARLANDTFLVFLVLLYCALTIRDIVLSIKVRKSRKVQLGYFETLTMLSPKTAMARSMSTHFCHANLKGPACYYPVKDLKCIIC